MEIALALLVVLGSGFVGALGGCVYGYGAAAQSAVISGYVVPPNRPLLRLLTAVNEPLTFLKAILFLAFLPASLVGLFFCVAAPAVLVSRFAPDSEVLLPVSYAVFFIGWWQAGWKFGRHVWRVYS